MYERIKNLSDISPLQKGDLLIQFPLAGTAINELDLSVPEGFRLYQIQSVENDNLRLLLCANIPTSRLNPAETGSAVSPADFSTFIVKHNDNMVADKSWWKQQ